jgi:DNA-directed RNA polymerase specialized sigma24 family protein
MMVHQKETRAVVRRIVFKFTCDPSLQEDLTQEALLHLWLREQQRPGQSESWYLQSCRFFLQNYLRNGRSVDSAKHFRSVCTSQEIDKSMEKSDADGSVSHGSVQAVVSTREILALLSKWLTPLERLILACLADGLGIRDIASRLNISHTSVSRSRRRIAALALKFGVEPLPNSNGRKTPARKGPASLARKAW